MSKKQNPLGIRIGDTVEIFFRHTPNDPAFLADVTEVVDRTTMGTDACISYKRHDGKTNEPVTPDGCSVSHVTRVVKRAPYVVQSRPPRNVFRDWLLAERERVAKTEHGWIGWYTFGGIRIGHIDALARAALAEATDELVRPFDEDKFRRLWQASQHAGKVASPNKEEYPPEWYTCVRWKVFRRFVLANRYKILATEKELEQYGRDYRRAWDEDDPFEIDAAA